MKRVSSRELSFPSSNGVDQIHVLAYVPADEIKGYVQIVHDTYEHIGIYEDVMKSFAYRGYLAFGHDHMGHGGSVSKEEDLGKLKGNNNFQNLISDTNLAFLLVFNEYPPKEKKTYKTTVVERKGLKKTTKELELVKPPLHAIIGVGFGSAIVRNYAVIYNDINCVCLCGDKGFPINGKLTLMKCNAEIRKHGEDVYSDKIPALMEKNYLKGKDTEYRFDWKTSNRELIEVFRNDPSCNFEYDLKYLKTILEMENSLGLSEWAQAYPPFLATYVVSGEQDPVSDNGREVHVMLKYFQQMRKKNLFFKIYKGYHNLFFEDCRNELINNLITLMEAVEKQQYGNVENT